MSNPWNAPGYVPATEPPTHEVTDVDLDYGPEPEPEQKARWRPSGRATFLLKRLGT